jgi:general stress protein 26
MTSRSYSVVVVRSVALVLVAASSLVAQLAPEPSSKLAKGAALQIMKAARYATLVTIGGDGQPQARIVDPLLAGDAGSIWIATNPLSRKVAEITKNPRVTMLFFNVPKGEFVTVLARATLVTDSAIKAKHWKPEWSPFYKTGPAGRDVVMFEVKPFQFEIVSAARGFKNDTITWRPVIVHVP